MFTGIIEALGRVKSVISNESNKSFWIESSISSQLKPDQSISHNGVCLTVEKVEDQLHKVSAVEETLKKSNLGDWKEGDVINLERCLLLSDRIDGHLVQGHVDAIGYCNKINNKKGSWELSISFPKKFAALVVEKGSICVNGISLTAFNVRKKSFSVAIIPYTFEHTNLQFIHKGDSVNLEFDLVGKYLVRSLSLEKQ